MKIKAFMTLLVTVCLAVIFAVNVVAYEMEITYHAFLQIESGTRQDAPEGVSLPLSTPDYEIYMPTGSSVTFEIYVEYPGFYQISFDYWVHGSALVLPEGRWFHNGVHPYRELRRVVFPVLWRATEDVFRRDRYNHEIPPTRERIDKWFSDFVTDPTGLQAEPLRFFAEAGLNTFTLEIYTGSIDIRNVTLVAPRRVPTYAQYRELTPAGASSPTGFIYSMHAVRPVFQNTTTIVPAADSGFNAYPFETHGRPLNMINEPTWVLNGETLFYEFTVPEDGYYHIAFRYMQSDKPNVMVFRTITINGEIPFAELQAYGFDYNPRWTIYTLGNKDGYFKFFLEAGTHVLGLEVDGSPYAHILGELRRMVSDLTYMNLQVRQIIGRDIDVLRDWRLENYFPYMEADLRQMLAELNVIADQMADINMGRRNSNQQIFVNMAIQTLQQLLRRPNEIPRRSNLLIEGSQSVGGLLQMTIHDMSLQAMTMNLIYVFSPDSPPEFENRSIFSTFVEWLRRFMATFRTMPEPEGIADAHTEIEVWITRTRYHKETLQRLTDTHFTPYTGIRVNYMLLMDEQRLTLSAIAGIQPDAAFGVGGNLPYEMGIRGILQNLREFDDFGYHIGFMPPGALLRMVVEDRVYGLPETLDFNVLFYRRDIVESLGLPVPETWEEVAQLMPELHRNGLNFQTGLAGIGLKGLGTTAPFIWQHGGELFTPDGMRTAIDSPEAISGIQLMTNLSTIFGMSLEIPSFYQSFRSGNTPFGIAGFETYMELMLAAPELLDSWAIALPPGVRGEDGVINRQFMGVGTSSIIFADSPNTDAAWELLKWYMSDEIQTMFAFNLATTYGMRLIFNSANIEAFRTLPIKPQDIYIILEQWEQMRELQLVPGWYMLERELSFLWNSVVFSDMRPRDALDRAIVNTDREIARRMREFGFMEGTEIIRDFPIHSVDDIRTWSADVNTR